MVIKKIIKIGNRQIDLPFKEFYMIIEIIEMFMKKLSNFNN